MLNAYEQRLVALYLANAASALHHRDREASDLAEWIADRENRMTFGGRKRRSPLRAGKVGRDEGMSGGKWRALHAALCEEYSVARKARPDRTAQRLRRLAKTTGLTRTDVDVLELVLRYQTQPVIESMIDDVFRSSRRFTPLNVQNPALPALLGVSANTVQGRLRGDAPLVRSGLVSVDSDGDLKALDRLNRLAAAPAGSGLDVHRLLLDAAPASELDWSDFDHVARDRDHIERVIEGALQSGAPGVNILLYGPPGTGKTEFCKVLAERLAVSLYSVGESDDKGDEPVRGERLQELRLAQRLLAGHGGSLLLFDEMEDLLADPFPAWGLFGPHSRMAFRNTGSKVYMHRLLEDAPTPTLWTMNSTRGVSETILRRMMFALELRRPTPQVRARIWARELARRGIEAPSEDVLSLAREFEATPGVGAGATAAAGLAGGGIAEVRHGVRSISRVLGCEKPPQGPPPRFDLGLIQSDTDPVTLAECLVRDADRGFSLCLQGPPGTGKSAFARYLAERLGLEVLQKRASDLLSPWVGATEQPKPLSRGRWSAPPTRFSLPLTSTVGMERFESLIELQWHGKHHGFSSYPPPLEQLQIGQPEKVRPCRRVGDTMTLRMGPNRVLGVRVPDGMRQQRKLTMVEVRRALQHPLDFRGLFNLPLDIRLDVGECTKDHVNLMHDEVGEVVLVRLGVQEGAPVSRGRIQQKAADRGELEHPVAVAQHCPIEEPPGGASVPVLERMVVGKPEVERNGADDRVHERPVVGALVGKPEHFPHPLGEFGRRWRRMQHPLVALVPYPHAVVVRPLNAALGVRIVQGVSREGGVQAQQDILRERLRSEATNGLHRPVVVEDHLLAPVSRTPSGANHVLGNDAGG